MLLALWVLDPLLLVELDEPEPDLAEPPSSLLPPQLRSLPASPSLGFWLTALSPDALLFAEPDELLEVLDEPPDALPLDFPVLEPLDGLLDELLLGELLDELPLDFSVLALEPLLGVLDALLPDELPPDALLPDELLLEPPALAELEPPPLESSTGSTSTVSTGLSDGWLV